MEMDVDGSCHHSLPPHSPWYKSKELLRDKGWALPTLWKPSSPGLGKGVFGSHTCTLSEKAGLSAPAMFLTPVPSGFLGVPGACLRRPLPPPAAAATLGMLNPLLHPTHQAHHPFHRLQPASEALALSSCLSVPHAILKAERVPASFSQALRPIQVVDWTPSSSENSPLCLPWRPPPSSLRDAEGHLGRLVLAPSQDSAPGCPPRLSAMAAERKNSCLPSCPSKDSSSPHSSKHTWTPAVDTTGCAHQDQLLW